MSSVPSAVSPSSSGTSGGGHAPWVVRLVLGVIACASVFPLLAWVYQLGSFDAWSAFVGAPLVIALTVAAIVLARTGRWPSTRAAIVAGALGGFIGTLGYDLFRVPFVVGGGLQLLAPIESYGVLLWGVESSSPFTHFTGWTYHFINGIGFGIAYAVIAAGRSWLWGVAWGMFLESAVIFSPFATSYGLITDEGVNWTPVIIAYAAHVPYGIAVGVFAQHYQRTGEWGIGVLRWPVAVTFLATVAVLVVWHQPYSSPSVYAQGQAVADGPSAVVVDGKMYPEWLRIPVGGCVTVENGDSTSVVLAPGGQVGAGEQVEICNAELGVHRIRVDDEPFSGGWLIVDPSLAAP